MQENNMTTYIIIRAYGMASNGLDNQIGWDIMAYEQGMSLPNWCSRWSLLRDAKQAMKDEGLSFTVQK